MAIYEIYLGGDSAGSSQSSIYPARYTGNEPMGVSAHKHYGMFALNRRLNMSRDKALKNYINGLDVLSGDKFGIIIIPPKSHLLHVMWEVKVPQPGLQFAIKTRTSAITIAAAVDASVVGVGNFNVPAANQWHATNDVIELELTAAPTGDLTVADINVCAYLTEVYEEDHVS